MSDIRDFIVSRVRGKLLKTFLSAPRELFYVRQLTRSTQEEINAVRRELIHMTGAGMVKSQPRGNRLYYWFNPEYLFYNELVSLVAKSTGLGAAIIKNQPKLGRITYAMLSGRFVRRLPVNQNQVDLLIVGEVIMPQLAALTKASETEVGREINYSIMSEEELMFRKRRRDPFLLDLLLQSRVMLIGSEDDLVS